MLDKRADSPLNLINVCKLLDKGITSSGYMILGVRRLRWGDVVDFLDTERSRETLSQRPAQRMPWTMPSTLVGLLLYFVSLKSECSI